MKLSVARRFCGPDESANGGWFCGHLAQAVGLGTTASVRLSSPPPLDQEMTVVPDGAAHRALAGEVQIARVSGIDPLPPHELVAPVSFARAVQAGPEYPGLREHPFGHCYSCGTQRRADDGLHLRPGPIGPGRFAAGWAPHEPTTQNVWSALDCPGGWSLGVGGRPMVLGTMTAQIERLPRADEQLVVMAWAIASAGRKHTAGTALYAGSELLAQARSVWIAVDPSSIRPA